MRIPIPTTFFVAVGWLALGRGYPLVAERVGRPAQRIAERAHEGLRKRADLLGWCAYLTVIGGGLPEKRVVLEALLAGKVSSRSGGNQSTLTGEDDPLLLLPTTRVFATEGAVRASAEHLPDDAGKEGPVDESVTSRRIY